MLYLDQENSADSGEPFFLYEFSTPTQTFRFIDHPTGLIFNGHIWEPLAISHGNVQQSNEMSKNAIKIDMPIGNDLSNLFIGWTPDFQVSVVVYRGHYGSDEYLTYWKGRVGSSKLKDDDLELSCESIFTGLKQSGVRARFQRNCRHAVYSAGCGLNKQDFAVKGIITAATGFQLTIDEAATKPNGWFNGGIIEFPDGSFRMIASHVGNQITITRASRVVTDYLGSVGWGMKWGRFWGGFQVQMYPGCDRTLATCKNKFDNILNNGSFKWIPQKNPMGGSSII